MPDTSRLLDAQDRLLAETTWDRNIVVVAGAGTGKTTILVNRILNLLMREPHPLSMTEIVALTFTNKAATEMKQRLRRELTKLAEHTDESFMALFRSRYRLSTQAVAVRAATALGEMEKSQIGTLHSFAAHLLRLHPLESGIDPFFQEDDGSRFNELFTSQWESWLADELGNRGQQHDRWRRVLGVTNLEDLRLLAEIVGGEAIDLNELERQCSTSLLNDTMRQWLANMRAKVSSLLATRANAKQLKTEKMLSATDRLFSILLEEGTDGMERLPPDDRMWLRKDIGKPTAGWDHTAFDDAKGVLTVVQSLLAVDQRSMYEMITLLRPFVTGLHQSFSASGWISFDGLLVRAKALLRDHPSVRARMKQTYRAILVDEFQDTDPVQYEIMLYLAERQGCAKSSWQELELEPGKLFIVGDPKQSIYAFRRADIEAFERVLKKILDGGGLACSLSTNFRSDGSVLTVVNEVFDRLLEAKEHVQPSNERLIARPQRKMELSVSGVQIRLVTGPEDDDFDAAAATRVEAEELARWMKEELLAAATVIGRDGLPAPLQPGHIALIFRKLTQAQDYLDALRRYDIAYLTDGEKHFYRRQEIVDLVNVLRVIDNPHDLTAVVGLLRSPLGGVADHDLLTLQQIGGFDITNHTALSRWAHAQSASLKSLYARLAELHRVAPTVPVPEVLTKIFDRLPVLELAAASLHGEQAMANLLKIRDMAEEVADRPHLTLTGFVELMMQRLMDQPEEAESALSEASLDAVRVLTIHKAKGLEFPVVVLPGLHQGSRIPRKGPVVHYDWSSRCYGVTIAGQCNVGSVMVGNKMAAREEAEQRRLLYVGMTRARDLLVLSGGRPQRAGRDTVWSALQEAMGEEILSEGSATLEVGEGRITRVVKPGLLTIKRHRAKTITTVPSPAMAPLVERQRLRREQWSLVRSAPKRLTPSLLQEGKRVPVQSISHDGASHAQAVGICAHALLERWDFAKTAPPKAAEIATLCQRFILSDGVDPTALSDDLAVLMRAFVSADFYQSLRQATILGRETPFVIPWQGRQLMEGVMDLIYRLDGKIWIADYKTDHVTASEAPARAAQYMRQAAIYRQAAAHCLGLSDVSFQFLFLRPGVSVEV
jgi:ATP-dependent helicase/nuclease subunit A